MKLEIVTPEKVAFSSDVAMVTLPGTEGDFGVLANHSPLISDLREGEITIYSSESQISQKYSVDGGIAHISPDVCTVLVTELKEAA